jgi:hypothetical protein
MIFPAPSLRLIYHFPNRFPKVTWFTGESLKHLQIFEVVFINKFDIKAHTNTKNCKERRGNFVCTSELHLSSLALNVHCRGFLQMPD